MGGRTALVPGFMAGVQAAHDRFGKVPFKRLFESAIVLAREGEPLSGALASAIKFKGDVLSRYPETKRIFTTRDADSMRKAIFFVSRSWPKH